MTIILIATICLICYLWPTFIKVKKELESTKQELTNNQKFTLKLEQDYKDIQLVVNNLNGQLSVLEKYSGIVDAEDRAKEIISNANNEANATKSRAALILKDANLHYEKTIKSAEAESVEIKFKSEQLYRETLKQSEKIIKEAEISAQKIAGDAYEAMKKAEFYEKTAKAMKNIVEGYGDQYIIPTISLIDNLAESYSHTVAGDDLKKSREKMRLMIKNDQAAECDYVENSRKETAIDFVLDAFNGKVDTIMASVKEDNYGTLSQKIKDAFQTVNANGAAFRHARIKEEYLKVRLEELKLASTVQALKEKEKEEQRRIREQIREEEKAIKEYERALKEAQKEEETVAKAMEKVRKELESANEQKKLIFEEKLKELEVKLKEAEEKNKRAQSMAELTKSGHVYIISNVGSFGEDILKIGMTRRLDPLDRVYELGDASVPFEFDVHAIIYSEDAPALEKELHRKFGDTKVNKVNPRKEFFKLEISKIKSVVENMGIAIHWTLTAEAREYRESLAADKEKQNKTAEIGRAHV